MSYCPSCECYECCACETAPAITTWTAADGYTWKIQEMGLSHIQNCMYRIKERNWREEYLPVFEKELKRRNSKLYKVLK